MQVVDPHAKLERLMSAASALGGSLTTRAALAERLRVARPNITYWFPRGISHNEVPAKRIGQLEAAFKADGIELPPRWHLISSADFDRLFDSTITSLPPLSHPRQLFGSLIQNQLLLNFDAPPLPGPTYATLGAVGVPAQSARPAYRVGSTTRIQVKMPFPGYLTLLSTEAFGGWWDYWSIDQILGVDRKVLEKGLRHLPEIPFTDPPSESALIAIITRAPILLPWSDRLAVSGAIQTDHSELREVAQQLESLETADRSVAIIEYRVIS